MWHFHVCNPPTSLCHFLSLHTQAIDLRQETLLCLFKDYYGLVWLLSVCMAGVTSMLLFTDDTAMQPLQYMGAGHFGGSV